MYSYEYEHGVLLLLRLMKFLHMRNPDAAKRIADTFSPVGEDEAYELLEDAIWSLFDTVDFATDDGLEISVASFSDPDLNRFYTLGMQNSADIDELGSAWRKKVQDMMEYFLLGPTNSVYHIEQHFSESCVGVEIWLSPDCYEPLRFANSLIDLLLYCQREVQRMESAPHNRETTEEAIWKEAA